MEKTQEKENSEGQDKTNPPEEAPPSSEVPNSEGNLSPEDAKLISDQMLQFRKDNPLRHRGEIKSEYKFWSEQPVPQFNKDIGVSFGPITKDNKVEEERQEPYQLPSGFEWQDVDVTKENELNRLYEFLKNNYVEDDDHMFRFDYCQEFLKWHLTAPGYHKEWLISVVREDKKKNKKKMVGFISGIPVKVQIHGTIMEMAEINFLCVNQNFRSNRLAPVLIKEVTRRIHLRNIWQAVYTSGTMLPKPFAQCTYYHRSLNIKKLVDIRFTYLGPNLNLARAKGIYKLPKENTVNGFRPMEEKDVNDVYKLLEEHESKFKVRGFYSVEEVNHWFLPKKNVVYSFVRDDNGKITDFISFYSLPSSILQHDSYKKLFACYSFFNINKSMSFKELMKNALILAKNNNFDVYNCLDIMENKTVFKDLLFGLGDGKLKYYFYNFVCPDTKPEDLSLVLM